MPIGRHCATGPMLSKQKKRTGGPAALPADWLPQNGPSNWSNTNHQTAAMKLIRCLPSVASFVVALGFCAEPALWAGFKRIHRDNPADPMAAQILQLDNGLTVYLTENHETPRSYADTAV